MYREVIEHPWSLPDTIKKLLDLNAGNDRGRIYRIVPDGFQQPKLPRLGKDSAKELVATLEHPNGWHRDTAARLLYQRQDKNRCPPLDEPARKIAIASRSHACASCARWPRDSTRIDVLTALNDQDATVREHGIKFSEKFNSAPSQKLFAGLLQMANDPSIAVR